MVVLGAGGGAGCWCWVLVVVVLGAGGAGCWWWWCWVLVVVVLGAGGGAGWWWWWCWVLVVVLGGGAGAGCFVLVLGALVLGALCFVLPCASRVRAEVKNFGANKCVGVRDVEKFERDLMQTGAHGIMCSLNSGIVQHDSVDFVRLLNGRFAFYLADVGEDADIVMKILRMIYKLDELSGGGEG